jgi:hypothetical protein
MVDMLALYRWASFDPTRLSVKSRLDFKQIPPGNNLA